MTSPDDAHVETTRETVTARRSPRYGRLMLTGAIVFMLVATILTFSFESQEDAPRAAVWGMMLIIGAAVGAAVGALLALLLGRAARSRTITTERVSVTDEADGTADETGSTADEADGTADDTAQE